MNYQELEILAKNKNFKLSERQHPGVVPQLVMLRPDGYEQVFNKDNTNTYIKLAEYEINNYIPFTNYSAETKQKFTVKDMLNLKNIKNFVQGTYNQYKSELTSLPEYEREQYQARLDICSKCVHYSSTDGKSCNKNILSHDTKGKLTQGCGCTFPGLTKAPEKVCPLGKWDKILDKHTWDSWKLGAPVTTPVITAQINKNDVSTYVSSMTTHDFGKVSPDAGIQVTEFEVKNISTKNIKIQSVSTSCGCTAPSYTIGVIKPGNTSNITINFNPKNQFGNIQKTANVTFAEVDDRKSKIINGKLTLYIKANVTKQLN